MERISRRALLIGGVSVVAAGTAAALTWDELTKVWYRTPGVDKPRKEGEVDHRGAEWDPASEANFRYADRPADYGIDCIVVHVTQSNLAVALKVFRDPAHRAAAHYVVGAEHGRIVQTVRELDVAYHAANRSFNERSIGIEHEGFVDRPQDFTDEMYRSSAKLAADICDRYDFPADRRHIVGHNEVPGADHTDPGPHWDWKRYIRLVREELEKRRNASRGRPAGGENGRQGRAVS